MKILIHGLGGVGGYYGAKLAKYAEQCEDLEVSFVARGEHLAQIRKNGLRVLDLDQEFVAHPHSVSDNPIEIGVVNYVIVATKSYDLESSIRLLRPSIGKNTVIFPLLNGGDISERIRELLPQNVVWNGCSYIVSRKVAAGLIQNFGKNTRIIFGYDKGINDELRSFEMLLYDAGIDATLKDDIRYQIWKKYYFISVTASLTSYFDCTFNELVNSDLIEFVQDFAKEFIEIARAEGIDTKRITVEALLKNASSLPVGATTSMHSDFMTYHTTEVDSLTGLIVHLSEEHRIDTPLYRHVYDELKKRG